jgi:branched-chain amino acid transport system substrate-binding protein
MRRRVFGFGVGVLAAGMVLSACGSDSKTQTSATTVAGATSSLPPIIKVGALIDETGAAAFAGKKLRPGMEFAVQEIADQGFLGTSKIQVEFIDPASDKQKAIDAMTKLASQTDTVAMVGPLFSQEAVATVPIAQSAGMPDIVVQSGVPGVVEAGNMIFRMTPPQSSIIGLTAKHVSEGGYKSVGLIYDGASPTIADLGKVAFPAAFDKLGVKVASSAAFQSTDTDFSAISSKVASAKPDIIGVLATGAKNATIITQLRQAGYTGPLFGQTGMAPAELNPVADKAEGTFFTATFHPDFPFPTSKDFVTKFTAKTGAAPSNFEAEGYDAIWLLARGIKEAGKADRKSIQAGVQKVTERGMDGALGHITFENRDARAPGALIVFKGGKYTLGATGA